MIIYDLKTMQICDIKSETVVALGTFDGGHSGHIKVLENARKSAYENNLKTAVYTFSSIPFVKSGKDVGTCIFSLEEKIKFIRMQGIDYLAIDDFENVYNMDGGDFVNSVLIAKLKAKCCSCGFNFRFGKGASYGASDLKKIFESRGGCVSICDPVCINGQTISSSYLRNLVESGNVEKMTECASPYSIFAVINHGKEFGRTIGIPTINQEIPNEKVALKHGVYITECEIGEDVFPSVTNVGTRPTTDGDNLRVNMETHIIGFSGNLYSSYIRVNFYKYLREEKKFTSIEDLKKAISENIEESKKFFGVR